MPLCKNACFDGERRRLGEQAPNSDVPGFERLSTAFVERSDRSAPTVERALTAALRSGPPTRRELRCGQRRRSHRCVEDRDVTRIDRPVRRQRRRARSRRARIADASLAKLPTARRSPPPVSHWSCTTQLPRRCARRKFTNAIVLPGPLPWQLPGAARRRSVSIGSSSKRSATSDPPTPERSVVDRASIEPVRARLRASPSLPSRCSANPSIRECRTD